MSAVQFGTNTSVRKRRVKFLNSSGGSITLKEGMPVCYVQDTTLNILGYDKGDSKLSDYTADGYQNEGKFMLVEEADSTSPSNFVFFAGVIAGSNVDGTAVANGGSLWLDIFEPNGAIVPVQCKVNVTAVNQKLYLKTSENYATSTETDNGYIGVACEVVDRSSTQGLVLAKLVDPAYSASGDSNAASDATSIWSDLRAFASNAEVRFSDDTNYSDVATLASDLRGIFSDLTTALSNGGH